MQPFLNLSTIRHSLRKTVGKPSENLRGALKQRSIELTEKLLAQKGLTAKEWEEARTIDDKLSTIRNGKHHDPLFWPTVWFFSFAGASAAVIVWIFVLLFKALR